MYATQLLFSPLIRYVFANSVFDPPPAYRESLLRLQQVCLHHPLIGIRCAVLKRAKNSWLLNIGPGLSKHNYYMVVEVLLQQHTVALRYNSEAPRLLASEFRLTVYCAVSSRSEGSLT